MRKKNIVIIVLLVIALLGLGLWESITYSKNIALQQQFNEVQQKNNILQSQIMKTKTYQQIFKLQEPLYVKEASISTIAVSEDYKKAYDALGTDQFFGLAMLYCSALPRPIIRTVSEQNWDLISTASIINNNPPSLLEAVEVLELESCSTAKIKDFYYQKIEFETHSSNHPPENGWIQVPTNSSGNYEIPLEGYGKETQTFLIKYSFSENSTYYGVISISP